MSLADIPRQYIQAWNDQNLDTILSLFTADATYQDPTQSGLIKDLMPRLFDDFIGFLPDLNNQIQNTVEQGAMVAVEWLAKGNNTTGWEPQGEVSFGGMDMFEIQDGKITALRSYFNAD